MQDGCEGPSVLLDELSSIHECANTIHSYALQKVAEVSVLLGCDTVSLGNLFPTWSLQRSKFVISTVEEKTNTSSRKDRNQLPSDAQSHSRHTEISATPTLKPNTTGNVKVQDNIQARSCKHCCRDKQ